MAGTSGAWYTLGDALNAKCISGFSTTDAQNGQITVEFNDIDVQNYKVWQFYVANYLDGVQTDISEKLSTVLAFEYENTSTKVSGEPIDVTRADMEAINRFGAYIHSWIAGGGGEWWVEDIQDTSNNEIYHDYLLLPAQNIYEAAEAFSKTTLPDRDYIMSALEPILNEVESDAPFKADYFNAIKESVKKSL